MKMKRGSLFNALKKDIRAVDAAFQVEYDILEKEADLRGDDEYDTGGTEVDMGEGWKESVFPASPCTYPAMYFAKKYGGEVRGFNTWDNPEAKLDCDDGHDFAVIDDRFIVDYWNHSYNDGPAVLDLESKADEKIIEKLYGDPGKWKLMRRYRRRR